MGASTTPPSTELPARIAVAYSGGRDSTALLHATARMAAQMGAGEGAADEEGVNEGPGIEVLALHVHHGLSTQADAWLAHAQSQCDAWAKQGLPVRLVWRKLSLQEHLAPGNSIEALARQARYAALAEMAHETSCKAVLLAHHRQDQAETFVLQALRGAGLAGLAAMPEQAEREGLLWLRPWLRQPRAAIEAYVQQHALAFVDDDSNADVRFARNRLRHEAWPALQALGAAGHAEVALAQAAHNLADVLACQREWLAAELGHITDAQPDATAGGAGQCAGHSLMLAAWAERPPAQQRELLRAWFQAEAGCALPRSWVVRLQTELMQAHASPQARSRQWQISLGRAGANGSWAEGAGQSNASGHLRLYRGRLRWQAATPVAPQSLATVMTLAQLNGQSKGPSLSLQPSQLPDPGLPPTDTECPGNCPISAPGMWRLMVDGAAQGALLVTAATPGDTASVPLALLAQCEWRLRAGGEQFQLAPKATPRCLKKQYQARGVPAWDRQAPLLCSGDALVFVPGLGVDARATSLAGQPRVSLQWQALPD
jgi:tRNA(Ile)-lysidine synthase